MNGVGLLRLRVQSAGSGQQQLARDICTWLPQLSCTGKLCMCASALPCSRGSLCMLLCFALLIC